MSLPHFLDVLKAERDGLSARIDKLATYLERGAAGTEERMHDLLKAQFHAMSTYMHMLEMRLKLFAEPGTAKPVPVASSPVLGEPVETGDHDEDRDGPVPFSG